MWTEAVMLQLGAAGIVMAVLISFAGMVLKNQAMSNRETVQAFTDAMKDVAQRMDQMINNISLITSQVSKIMLESENRLQTSLQSNREAVNRLTSEVIEMRTRSTVDASAEHADARIKHADDINTAINTKKEGDAKP